MTRRRFQILVVVWQLLSVGIYIVDYATEHMLFPDGVIPVSPPESVLDPNRYSILELLLEASFWAQIFLGLFAALGLIFFKSWGRTALLVYVMFVLINIALSEPYPFTSWTSMITYAANLVDGVLVTLVYFSPIRKMFKVNSDIRPEAKTTV